jgi:hypothetical protein
MTFLSPFEYDIFISYARIDDDPVPGTDFHWVEHFEQRLNHAFTRVFGERGLVRVWRDTGEIGGNTYFEEAIQEGVNKSALFLALFSNSYLRRDFCRRELQEFYRKTQGEPYGLKIGSLSRLFNVRLQEVSQRDWPDELEEREGFKFHDDSELGETLKPGAAFDAQFRELVVKLVHTLRAFKTAIVEQQQKEEAAAARAARTVFLSHTEGSMRELSGRIARELEEEGVNVITRVPPPYETSAHESRVIAGLGSADLAVHMLDGAPGLEMQDDTTKFYSCEQVRLGLLHAKSQLIWVPDTVKIESVENDAHGRLLGALEKRDAEALSRMGLDAAARARLGLPAYNFVHEPKDSLKRIILDKLDEAARAGQWVEGGVEDDAPPVAVIDTHLKDTRFANDLGEFFTGRGVEVRIIPEGDGPRGNDLRFESALKQASIFFVVFGQVAVEWVRARLDRALQIMVKEKCALSLWGVYVPPIDEEAGMRPFTPPKPPRGSLRPYRIDNPADLQVILRSLGVIAA